MLAQQKQQLARAGKLRRVAEAAVPGIECLLELLHVLRRAPRSRHASRCRPSTVQPAPQLLGQRSADCSDFVRSRATTRAISCRISMKPGRPHRDVGGKYVPPKNGLQVRRQPHAHRPAARPGRRLHERHVDAIDVGPLLAIHLDRHEIALSTRRHSRLSNDSCSMT